MQPIYFIGFLWEWIVRHVWIPHRCFIFFSSLRKGNKGVGMHWGKQLYTSVSRCGLMERLCAYMCAKSLQSCPSLCGPMDHSPPGSSCPWDSLGKNTGMSCCVLRSPPLIWDFPGGPVVKTQRFHCTGCGFDPWSENLNPTCLIAQPNK